LRQVNAAIEDLWLFLLQMMTTVSNKNVKDNNVMTQIQATARLSSPSPPLLDARGAIVTIWIAMMTTMHAAVAVQIVGETTRALKIVGGTTEALASQRNAM
jgi:hypothetical protein